MLWIIIIFIIAMCINGTIEKSRKKYLEKENFKKEAIAQAHLLNIENNKIESAFNFVKLNQDLIDGLVKKYYYSFCNLFDSYPYNPFKTLVDMKNEYPLDLSIIISGLKTFSETALYLSKRDGYKIVDYSVIEFERFEVIKNKTQSFINGLKKRLVGDDKLNFDFIDFDALFYMLLRNCGIKWLYNVYIDEIGFDNIIDFCKNEEIGYKEFFIGYKICAENIYSPIKPKYIHYSSAIEKKFLELQKQSEENSFFDNNIYQYSNKIQIENNSTVSQDCKTTIYDIDNMDGRSFEIFIEELFRKRGYKTTLTPTSGDYGIDIIIESEFTKIGIQTKCYNEKVSNSAIQEVVTGLKHYNLDKAMVITNNYFTPNAIKLAKDNNVVLWNRDKLILEIENNE